VSFAAQKTHKIDVYMIRPKRPSIVVTVQRVGWLLLVFSVMLLMRLSRWLPWQQDADRLSQYHTSSWPYVISDIDFLLYLM